MAVLVNCTVSSSRAGASIYTSRSVQLDTVPPRKAAGLPGVGDLVGLGGVNVATLYDTLRGVGGDWQPGDQVTVLSRKGAAPQRVGTSYVVYSTAEMAGFLPHVTATLILVQDLTGLRAVASSLMPTPCTILRSGVTLATTVCSLTPEPASIQPIPADRLQPEKRWILRMPYGTDCRRGDVVQALGQQYALVEPSGPRSYELAEQWGAVIVSGTTSNRTTPCQVLRKTSTSDGMGGFTDTWANISIPDLTCRLAPGGSGASETIEDERLGLLTKWDIVLPLEQDVTSLDRIVALSHTYEVTQVLLPQTFAVENVAYCVLVQ